ncbi:ribosomal L28e/Mak16 [Dipodascopsis tothii]|uniref:ribosomal L28e/Mak16 n=1 Tax=Dipodascopsis tothii TaxID=44089 RepID=UPI0034CDF58B
MASNDLVWELTRANNSYLVSSKTAGGVQFSRDPLNLVNKHSYKYAGYANSKALGVSLNDKGAIVLSSKKGTTTFKPNKSQRKVYLAVANASKGYRDDLRKVAVARASALLASKTPKKTFPKKVRGKKASE